MRSVSQDKYFLRDLHREIDLYDRKLIHMVKHEEFATEALRAAAMKKLATKRESLAATARSLAASGIEFHDNDLPRSFRPEGWTEPEAAQENTEASAEQVAAALAPAATDFGARVGQMQRQALREEESPLATALGSWQDDLAAYKRRRQKSAPVALPTAV